MTKKQKNEIAAVRDSMTEVESGRMIILLHISEGIL
jgi:hypothetical protein